MQLAHGCTHAQTPRGRNRCGKTQMRRTHPFLPRLGPASSSSMRSTPTSPAPLLTTISSAMPSRSFQTSICLPVRPRATLPRRRAPAAAAGDHGVAPVNRMHPLRMLRELPVLFDPPSFPPVPSITGVPSAARSRRTASPLPSFMASTLLPAAAGRCDLSSTPPTSAQSRAPLQCRPKAGTAVLSTVANGDLELKVGGSSR